MFYFFVLMMIICKFFVVAPLIFRPSWIERQDINILVFQERLKEIEEEDPDNAPQLKSELKRAFSQRGEK